MEGNVPGHPLGFDDFREFGPIKMVGGGESGGDENDDDDDNDDDQR